MTLEEKLKTVKASEILEAMIEGLKKEHVKVNMETYGTYNNHGICYGCAATNAICELSGIVFLPYNLNSSHTRAEAVSIEHDLLRSFERAVNALRVGDIACANMFLRKGEMPARFPRPKNWLTAMYNDNYREVLPEYEAYLEEVREHEKQLDLGL